MPGHWPVGSNAIRTRKTEVRHKVSNQAPLPLGTMLPHGLCVWVHRQRRDSNAQVGCRPHKGSSQAPLPLGTTLPIHSAMGWLLLILGAAAVSGERGSRPEPSARDAVCLMETPQLPRCDSPRLPVRRGWFGHQQPPENRRHHRSVEQRCGSVVPSGRGAWLEPLCGRNPTCAFESRRCRLPLLAPCANELCRHNARPLGLRRSSLLWSIECCQRVCV